MKDLHDVAPPVDENEYPATAYILVHGRYYNTAQGVKTLPHIYRQGVQVVVKGLVEMEHNISQEDR